MPDEDLLQHFEVIIDGAQEPLVRKYLEDAAKCFNIGVYNGAVIFVWNAIICYIQRVIEVVGIAFFIYKYRKVYPKKDMPSDLWQVNDSMLLEICEGMGLLSHDVHIKLDRLREHRNDCAHPSGIFMTAEDTLALMDSIRDYISRKMIDERLTNIGILREFIKEVKSKQDGEEIAPWVQEDLYPRLAHDLLTIYLEDEAVKDASGIEGLWKNIWSRIDESTRQLLWDRLSGAVSDALEDESSFRSPYELANFIVWPSSDEEHRYRDKICRLYIEWLDRRIREDGLEDHDDESLAIMLKWYMPTSQREQLQPILEKIIRR